MYQNSSATLTLRVNLREKTAMSRDGVHVLTEERCTLAVTNGINNDARQKNHISRGYWQASNEKDGKILCHKNCNFQRT